MRRHLKPGEHLRADECPSYKLLVDGEEIPLAFHAHRWKFRDEVVVESWIDDEKGRAHICETCWQPRVQSNKYRAEYVEVEFGDAT